MNGLKEAEKVELRSAVYFVRDESFYVTCIADSIFTSWYYFKYCAWRIVLSEYVKGGCFFEPNMVRFAWISYEQDAIPTKETLERHDIRVYRAALALLFPHNDSILSILPTGCSSTHQTILQQAAICYVMLLSVNFALQDSKFNA